MTLEEVRRQIWENLGEPTDLDPDTDVSYIGGPLLNWVVNEAQRQLSMWKDPITRMQVRFHNLFGTLYFSMSVVEGVLSQAPESETRVDLYSGGAIPETDLQRYRSWILRINGEQRLIVDYDENNVATLLRPLSTLPSIGDEYKLFKRHVYLLRADDPWASEHVALPAEVGRLREGNFSEILKITDLQERVGLSKAPHGANFIRYNESTGTPRQWYRFANRVVMDQAPVEPRWYEMEYYRLPSVVSEPEDVPEIPEQFHYGLVLWGTEWGLRRAREADQKYSAKRDLIDFMRSTKTEWDVEFERSSDHGRMEVR